MIFIRAIESISPWQQLVSVDDLWDLKALAVRKVVPGRDHQQVRRRDRALLLGSENRSMIMM